MLGESITYIIKNFISSLNEPAHFINIKSSQGLFSNLPAYLEFPSPLKNVYFAFSCLRIILLHRAGRVKQELRILFFGCCCFFFSHNFLNPTSSYLNQMVYPFFFCFVFFFFFDWRIIALKRCVDFCHVTVQIIIYIFPLSRAFLPSHSPIPLFQVIAEHQAGCPV